MRSGCCGLFCEFRKADVKSVNGGCAGAWTAFHGGSRTGDYVTNHVLHIIFIVSSASLARPKFWSAEEIKSTRTISSDWRSFPQNPRYSDLRRYRARCGDATIFSEARTRAYTPYTGIDDSIWRKCLGSIWAFNAPGPRGHKDCRVTLSQDNYTLWNVWHLPVITMVILASQRKECFIDLPGKRYCDRISLCQRGVSIGTFKVDRIPYSVFWIPGFLVIR